MKQTWYFEEVTYNQRSRSVSICLLQMDSSFSFVRRFGRSSCFLGTRRLSAGRKWNSKFHGIGNHRFRSFRTLWNLVRSSWQQENTVGTLPASLDEHLQRERERETRQFRLEIWYSQGSANRRTLPPSPPWWKFRNVPSRLAKNTRISDRWSLRPIFRGSADLASDARKRKRKEEEEGRDSRVKTIFDSVGTLTSPSSSIS